MNYDQLTDDEFLNYVTLSSNDPVIKRLVKLTGKADEIISDLYREGMNTNLLFENCYSPAEYVHHLTNELEFINNELADAQEKVARMERTTVLELMAKLYADMDQVTTDKARVERERDSALSKLSMWSKLNGQGV